MFQVKDNFADCKVWIFDYSNYLFIISFWGKGEKAFIHFTDVKFLSCRHLMWY